MYIRKRGVVCVRRQKKMMQVFSNITVTDAGVHTRKHFYSVIPDETHAVILTELLQILIKCVKCVFIQKNVNPENIETRLSINYTQNSDIINMIYSFGAVVVSMHSRVLTREQKKRNKTT